MSLLGDAFKRNDQADPAGDVAYIIHPAPGGARVTEETTLPRDQILGLLGQSGGGK